MWLNELQDAFVESVAAPWFLTQVYGTGSINIVLRALGNRVGRGAWVECYWFPEADLCICVVLFVDESAPESVEA